MNVYVVVEFTEEEERHFMYPEAYLTYKKAVEAVKTRHAELLADEERPAEVDEPEDPSGTTLLYIEKGINIYVHRVLIKLSGGKKKSTRRRKL